MANIKKKKYSNIVQKFKYVYEFYTEFDLEDPNNIKFLDLDQNTIKQTLIDSLVNEFRINLNSIIFGDPAGKEYVEHMKRTNNKH